MPAPGQQPKRTTRPPRSFSGPGPTRGYGAAGTGRTRTSIGIPGTGARKPSVSIPSPRGSGRAVLRRAAAAGRTGFEQGARRKVAPPFFSDIPGATQRNPKGSSPVTLPPVFRTKPVTRTHELPPSLVSRSQVRRKFGGIIVPPRFQTS